MCRARQTAREGVEAAKKTATVLRSAIRHLLAVLRSLAAALVAGGWVTAFIVLLICLIALVAGSAYGIFFAAETPDENAVTVQAAVEQLTEEYRDQLEEIEDSTEYDRQEIESNDGNYAIAWQDVLAVFASQTAGDANGAAVAYLDEDNVDRLRTVLWNMNELDWRTETQTREVEQTNEAGEPETTTITETVLVIQLTHHTPEEMRDAYHFTERQNEYLTLLSGEDTATLWGELLGGFVQGRGGSSWRPAWIRCLRMVPCNGRCRWREQSPRRKGTAPILSREKSVTTAVPISRHRRERQFWPPQTAPSPLPTPPTAGEAVTGTMSRSTTAAG